MKSNFRLAVLSVTFVIFANYAHASYNYEHFTKVLLSEEDGPYLKPGNSLPQSTFFGLNAGGPVTTSQILNGKPIVIEFGAITCPVYNKRIVPMNELIKKFSGQVDFYTLYVREAHPGSNYSNHKTIEQKIAYAADLKKLGAVESSILVDNLDGDFHHQFGAIPNTTLLVSSDGVIVVELSWNDPDKLEDEIQKLLANDGSSQNFKIVDLHKHFHMPLGWMPKWSSFWDTLRRAGNDAVDDVDAALPAIVWYSMHG